MTSGSTSSSSRSANRRSRRRGRARRLGSRGHLRAALVAEACAGRQLGCAARARDGEALTTAEAEQLPQQDPEAKQAIAEELADVLIYCISLADTLNYDIAEIILDKMDKNERKYPAEEYQGRY